MFSTIERAIEAYKAELCKYQDRLSPVPASWDWDQGSEMEYHELKEWNDQLTGWEKALGLTRKEITSIYRKVGIVRRGVFGRDSKVHV